MQFGIVDIIVFAVCSLLSLVIGGLVVKFGGSLNTSTDYFLGGKKQHFIPVCLSLVVSYQSSILVLGTPAEVYIYGPMYLVSGLGALLVTPVITNIATPLYKRLNLTSLYEYFNKRFPSNHVRYLMVASGILYNVLYTGLVLLGPSIVLQPVLGIPDWSIIICLSVLTILYTSVGGIKAVLWTDAFQAFVMVSGLMAVLITGTQLVGGTSEVLRIAADYQRTRIFDFNPDPTIRHTFWTVIIGRVCRTLLLIVSQSTVQRLNSIPDKKRTLYAVYGFSFLSVAINQLAGFCGIVAFAYYAKLKCDPLSAGLISNPNQIMIATVSDLFAHLPGMTGLFMSAVLCASISTVSSCLNGLAAITSEDFVKMYRPTITDNKATFISKISVFIYGLLSTLIAITLRFVKGNLLQMFTSILGAMGGPIVGVFILSVFFKKTTSIGAISGGLAGLIIALWLSLGYNFSTTLPRTPWLPLGPTYGCPNSLLNQTNVDVITTLNSTIVIASSRNDPEQVAVGLDKMYSLSYQYFSTVSIIVTVLIGITISLIRPSDHQVPPEQLVSIKKSFCCCCFGRCQCARGQGKRALLTPEGEAIRMKQGDDQKEVLNPDEERIAEVETTLLEHNAYKESMRL